MSNSRDSNRSNHRVKGQLLKVLEVDQGNGASESENLGINPRKV
jgi:hypothetical protein